MNMPDIKISSHDGVWVWKRDEPEEGSPTKVLEAVKLKFRNGKGEVMGEHIQLEDGVLDSSCSWLLGGYSGSSSDRSL